MCVLQRCCAVVKCIFPCVCQQTAKTKFLTCFHDYCVFCLWVNGTFSHMVLMCFFFASLFLCSSLFFFFLFSLYCDRLIATGVKACAVSLYSAWITDGLSIFPFHLPSKCRVKERVYSKSFRNNVMSTNARAHSLTKKKRSMT